MLVFGLGLSLLGVGLFCSLLFKLSTYALPATAGLTSGFAAAHAGAPGLAALAVGVFVALATLALGWFAVAVTRSTALKAAIALTFAAPAALAGYHVAVGLGGIGLPQGLWIQALGLLGAAAAGVTAWLRTTQFNPLQERAPS